MPLARLRQAQAAITIEAPMKNPSAWIARNVSRLRSAAKDQGAAAPAPPPRSTHERLAATLRRADEALPPRQLRRLLADLQAVAAPQVSELEGGRSAQTLIDWYAQATPAQRHDLWLLMCEQFGPDAQRIQAVRQQLEQAQDTDQMALQIKSTTLIPAIRRQAIRINAAERIIMPSIEASTRVVSCGI